MAVCNYGAALVHAAVPDKKGSPVDVVLGYDDAAGYEKGGMSVGGIVGRAANRIGGASFDLNGRTYNLTPNAGTITLHGGRDFYVHRLWQTADVTDSSVTFRLESPDGDQGFPGNLVLDVTYTLTDSNEIRIDYRAVCDADTLLSPTNHSYFNLSGDGSGDVRRQLVTILADAYTVLGPGQVPTGQLQDVTGTDYDFRNERPIGAAMNGDYDFNYALNGSGFRKTAEMYSPETGIRMTVSTDMPGIQFYTAVGLDETGRKGAYYGPFSAACFEAQFFPDAIHHENFKKPVLRAGEEFRSTTVYSFETEKQSAK